MNSEDRRLNDRTGINLPHEANQFILEKAGQDHQISNIRDVSISGVGLEMQQEAFHDGDKVTLKFNSDDFQMDISGTIIWTNREGHNSALGIEFDASNGGDNTLFFMAMRKYLDEFDSLPIDA